ncbi:MAG: DNA adenine methylase [Chloroflexi bacterium]|nr:DNA adenine methylase [Chloroflexota bacterium]
MIVSPLRYPGGKSRALGRIAQQLPAHFSEYREPFVGGGSVFLYLRQKFPDIPMWINDLNFDLFCFWSEAQRDAKRLAAAVQQVKEKTTDGRILFETLRGQVAAPLSDFDRAVRFFVLNRISFSGTVDSGGYSEGAFRGRFTNSSITRLVRLGTLLGDVKITNDDYTRIIEAPGQDVFIFLDPPYLTATKSRLYGVNGTLHTSFDHKDFAQQMRRCPYQWLITYDDSPEIRRDFSFASLDAWELQYGMNNYKRDFAAKGKELFITNYPFHSRRVKQLQLFEKKSKWQPFKTRRPKRLTVQRTAA